MESPNRRYLSAVDELRADAALLVFFFHAEIFSYWATGGTGWLRALTPIDALLFEGHTGVALFMVLSGFILSKDVIGRPVSYWGFLRNRLLRVAPLTVIITVFAFYGTKNAGLERLFAPILLVQNASHLALIDPAWLAGMLWTISTEFQLYLIAPFVFAFVARHGVARWLLPTILLAFVLKAIVLLRLVSDPTANWSVPYFTIVGRMSQFLVGVGLGALWPRLEGLEGRLRRVIAIGLFAAGLIGAFMLSFALNRGGGQYVWHHWRFVHQDLEAGIWTIFIAGYVLLDPLASSTRLRRIVSGIGIVSFSFYVLHAAILQIALLILPRVGLTLPAGRLAAAVYSAALILPPCLALAALAYWCIERPFLLLRSRYVGRSHGA